MGLGGFEPPTSPLSGVRSNQLSYRPIGGAMRDRTADLLNANQVLSQLSYSPQFLWLFPLFVFALIIRSVICQFANSFTHSGKQTQLKKKSFEINSSELISRETARMT